MKNLFFLFLLVFTATLQSQTIIKGNVCDKKGDPVPFANIYIDDSYDGTTSDISGNFSFTTTQKDTLILAVSCIGFTSEFISIYQAKETVTKNVILKTDFAQLDDVVITAGSFEASDEKKSVVLSPMDIVTTAGGAADIYETMKMLPGTQQVGETEGLFVRGGAASETKTIIDEMTVQNPFFSSVPDVPQRSRFSPFMFKGTMFSTGGYSALYGQALSSALVLNSIDLADTTETGLGIHMAGINAFHTKKFKNTSLSLGGEYSNLRPYFSIVKQETDWVKPPISLGSELVFRHKFSRDDLLKFYIQGSKNNLSMNYPMATDETVEHRNYALENTNIYLNSSYRKKLGSKYKIFGGISYSDNADQVMNNKTEAKSNEQLMQTKLILTRYLGNNNKIYAGAEMHTLEKNGSYGNLQGRIFDEYVAAFAETNLHMGKRFAIRIGFRAVHSGYINKINLAPRLSIAYKTGIHSQVSFACGSFFQQVEDSIRYKTNNLDFEKANHYILNYQWVKNERIFRAEVYNKVYRNLVSTYLTETVSYANSGNGFARGIDLFFRDKKTIKNSDYWISYSYIDTKRKYRNLPAKLTPSFVSQHNLSLVAKYTFQSTLITVGSSYNFASGRPYYFQKTDEFQTEYTPQYHSLNFSVSKIASVFNQFTVFYAALYNALNRENIFQYQYSPNGQNKVTIGPPSLRSFFIGCFISIR